MRIKRDRVNVSMWRLIPLAALYINRQQNPTTMARDFQLDAGLDRLATEAESRMAPRSEPRLDQRADLRSNPKPDQKTDTKADAEIDSMLDLFKGTLRELQNEAPIELLISLRESLEHIRVSNPSSAYTAKACLLGLASDSSPLLHVLAAAYLVNGGVMLKHSPANDAALEAADDLDFRELENELNRLSESGPSLLDD